MMGGAGLMALTIPWRGARMTPAAEHAPQQRYVSPPPPRAAPVESAPPPPPPPPPPPAAAFPGVPPLKAAQDMAAAPMQPSAQEPAGKLGIKPLQYKKGA
jgi:hypothetical protein